MLEKIMFHVPIYNMFRVPSRFLFIFDFSVAVIFSKVLSDVLKKQINLYDLKGKIRIISIIILISTLLVIYVIKLISSYVNNSSISGNFELIVQNFSLSNPAIYIPLFLLIIFNIYLQFFDKLNNKYVFSFLVILIFVDLQIFSFNYTNVFTNPSNTELPDQIKKIMNHKERAWPIMTNEDFQIGGLSPNRNSYFGIHVLNGYVSFFPENYKNILKFDERGVNINWFSLLANNQIISSLNTKYIIANNKLADKIKTLNVINSSFAG